MRIFTIGHSTRSLEEFLEILKKFQVELVVDVRKWPSSQKFPWFNKEELEKELNNNKIQYIHFPELGGYRKEGYLTFSKTEEFSEAIEKLLKTIDEKNTAILCSELLWFRCHRKYIAEKLATLGHTVVHIFDKNKTQEHKPVDKEVRERMKLVLFCDKKAKKMKEATPP